MPSRRKPGTCSDMPQSSFQESGGGDGLVQTRDDAREFEEQANWSRNSAPEVRRVVHRTPEEPSPEVRWAGLRRPEVPAPDRRAVAHRQPDEIADRDRWSDGRWENSRPETEIRRARHRRPEEPTAEVRVVGNGCLQQNEGPGFPAQGRRVILHRKDKQPKAGEDQICVKSGKTWHSCSMVTCPYCLDPGCSKSSEWPSQEPEMEPGRSDTRELAVMSGHDYESGPAVMRRLQYRGLHESQDPALLRAVVPQGLPSHSPSYAGGASWSVPGFGQGQANQTFGTDGWTVHLEVHRSLPFLSPSKSIAVLVQSDYYGHSNELCAKLERLIADISLEGKDAWLFSVNYTPLMQPLNSVDDNKCLLNNMRAIQGVVGREVSGFVLIGAFPALVVSFYNLKPDVTVGLANNWDPAALERYNGVVVEPIDNSYDWFNFGSLDWDTSIFGGDSAATINSTYYTMPDQLSTDWLNTGATTHQAMFDPKYTRPGVGKRSYASGKTGVFLDDCYWNCLQIPHHIQSRATGNVDLPSQTAALSNISAWLSTNPVPPHSTTYQFLFSLITGATSIPGQNLTYYNLSRDRTSAWVSRIDPLAVAINSVGRKDLGAACRLLGNYLDRNHNFRSRIPVADSKHLIAYLRPDYDSTNSRSVGEAIRNIWSAFGQNNSKIDLMVRSLVQNDYRGNAETSMWPSRSNYFQMLSAADYNYVYTCGHGCETAHLRMPSGCLDYGYSDNSLDPNYAARHGACSVDPSAELFGYGIKQQNLSGHWKIFTDSGCWTANCNTILNPDTYSGLANYLSGLGIPLRVDRTQSRSLCNVGMCYLLYGGGVAWFGHSSWGGESYCKNTTKAATSPFFDGMIKGKDLGEIVVDMQNDFRRYSMSLDSLDDGKEDFALDRQFQFTLFGDGSLKFL